MKYIFFILFLFPIVLFSQTIDIRIPVGGGSVGNADSLGNQPPAFYLNRTNHTNTQAQSTIDDLQDSLNTKADTSSIHDAVNVSDSLKAGTSDSLLIGVNALVVKTNGQVGINIDTPDGSAILDISDITKGFLYPRMTTTQRDNIPTPAAGLSVYNTTNDDPNFFNGTDWRRVTHAPSSSLKVGGVIFAMGVSALEGDSANFFWDTTTTSLGIRTGNPSEALEVNGNIKSDTVKIDVLELNGTSTDGIIPASSFTGNLGNSTTGADTIYTNIVQSNIAVSSIKDSLVTKCECSDVVDDGTITLPDATTQSLVIWIDGDDEWALAAIQADGTVTLPATVGSVVNTDTDTNLCIFDSGTGATIKNRLGSTKTICYETKYKQ